MFLFNDSPLSRKSDLQANIAWTLPFHLWWYPFAFSPKVRSLHLRWWEEKKSLPWTKRETPFSSIIIEKSKKEKMHVWQKLEKKGSEIGENSLPHAFLLDQRTRVLVRLFKKHRHDMLSVGETKIDQQLKKYPVYVDPTPSSEIFFYLGSSFFDKVMKSKGGFFFLTTFFKTYPKQGFRINNSIKLI